MKRTKHKLTHLHSTTLDAGYLVPFLLQPTLPNDVFRIGLSTFLRAQPMLAPLMHEVYLDTQYWFVPNRLLWTEWEEFITGGENLDYTPSFPVVKSTASDCNVGSLWDYFGFPRVAGVEVSALPFRAMAEIWNTRYRDQDLQQEIPISYGSGNDTTTSRDLLSPSFGKDYFTIARPFTQRGADIFVPIVEGGDNTTTTYRKRTFNVGSDAFPIYSRALYASNPEAWKNFRLIITLKRNESNPVRIEVMQGKTSGMLSAGDRPDITNFDELRPATFEDWLDYLFIGGNSKKIIFYTNSRGSLAPLPIFPETNIPFAIGNELRDFLSGHTGSISGPFAYISGNLFRGYVEGLDESYAVIVESVENVPVFCNATLEADESLPSDINPAVAPLGKFFIRRHTTSATLSANGGSEVKNGKYSFAFSSFMSGQLSVRDIRQSSALQRYAERSLKYGNRYEEFIQREFGCRPRDSRIQRPEYIGGGRGMLNISEVLQTAESTDSGVGTMRGHGIGAINQRPIRFRAVEHGLIIGLLSIRPRSVYTQGVDREFLKRSRLDFFTPELASIGMQEVLTQELFATAANKDSIFGYSDRYQEYRYHKPLVTGEFRDNLSFWNMARIFENAPELNDEFINMKHAAETFKRPFQIQDNSAHAFVCMLKNHIRAYRPIPKRAKDLLK